MAISRKSIVESRKSKDKPKSLIDMKRILLACMMVSVAVAVSASTVTYTADNTSIFPNPERGFITMIGGNLSESNPYGVKGQESNLDNHKQKDKIEQMSILKPFSFVLEDDDKESIEELYLVDDDTAILHEDLMVDLDKDLNDFLDKLLKD